jgi:aryl-alcohol dehydrogenase-like predicted oxidoreductase
LVISRRGVIGSISKSKAHTMKYKKLGRTGLFVSEICLGTKHAYDVVDAIRPIAERHGVSVARAALAWLLHQKSVMSVIVGAKTPEQLADNIAAAELTLSEDDLAALDKATALAPEYPRWMVDRFNSGRVPQPRVATK